MTTPKPTHRPQPATEQRCPACGQPIDESTPASVCPLCGHQLHSARTGTDDATPYASNPIRGWRAWFSTSFWVFGAGSQRLALLALTRRSGPSTRFFRHSLLVFAFAAALFSLSQFGWHPVTDAPTQDSMPEGKGWLSVAFAPPGTASPHSHLAPTELWWSLPRAAIAVPATFGTGLFAGWVLLAVVGAGSEKALTRQYRGQERLAGALRYGTGWVLWLLAASVASLLLPLCYVGEVTGGWFALPRLNVYLVAALIASVGLLMGWFWLVRAAGTTPPATRSRVVLFHAVGTPLIAGGMVIGWWIGLVYGFRLLLPVLKLQW